MPFSLDLCMDSFQRSFAVLAGFLLDRTDDDLLALTEPPLACFAADIGCKAAAPWEGTSGVSW